mmetsp:Transcript_30526/g.87530  ORF Transcript_30526/g.87530 Transcript_30526/m.87530 type:complete len:360 (-) Transcript_30526:349-1428(-)
MPCWSQVSLTLRCAKMGSLVHHVKLLDKFDAATRRLPLEVEGAIIEGRAPCTVHGSADGRRGVSAEESQVALPRLPSRLVWPQLQLRQISGIHQRLFCQAAYGNLWEPAHAVPVLEPRVDLRHAPAEAAAENLQDRICCEAGLAAAAEDLAVDVDVRDEGPCHTQEPELGFGSCHGGKATVGLEGTKVQSENIHSLQTALCQSPCCSQGIATAGEVRHGVRGATRNEADAEGAPLGILPAEQPIEDLAHGTIAAQRRDQGPKLELQLPAIARAITATRGDVLLHHVGREVQHWFHNSLPDLHAPASATEGVDHDMQLPWFQVRPSLHRLGPGLRQGFVAKVCLSGSSLSREVPDTIWER